MGAETVVAMKAIMIQGTGSDVGKSLIVAGLCRLARKRGIHVAPFKPQNMSNQAAVCPGGGEIGRAQALQAMAAGVEPCADFNPVLLKPQADHQSQVIVHGRPSGTLSSSNFRDNSRALLPAVKESLDRLSREYELLIVEGAGSPAEVNLRAGDIANMGFATKADVPVCLVGDIDRGGVIAAFVGTHALLGEEDRKQICGFIVNKFRGDPALFQDGLAVVRQNTGWRCFGMLPWLDSAAILPAEDAMSLRSEPRRQGGGLRVVSPVLSRISNSDDLDALRLEPEVDFSIVQPGSAIPRSADAIVLCGTKSTVSELEFVRSQGWHHDVISHARNGGYVLGVCGGFQMLGHDVRDPDGVDGPPASARGLGLLDMSTTMVAQKTVRRAKGRCAISGTPVCGYEIHSGQTAGPGLQHPMLHLESGPDGARNENGRIEGTYLHGLLANDNYRRDWLRRLGARPDPSIAYLPELEKVLDEVADALALDIDVDGLLGCAQVPRWNAE